MHELSIVMNIIETAEAQVRKHHAHTVESIDLVIGDLSGVDSHALDFAWDTSVKNTVLESAQKNVIRVTGKARCLECDCEFAVKELYDPCPICGTNLLQIVQGKELQIKSMIVN